MVVTHRKMTMNSPILRPLQTPHRLRTTLTIPPIARTRPRQPPSTSTSVARAAVYMRPRFLRSRPFLLTARKRRTTQLGHWPMRLPARSRSLPLVTAIAMMGRVYMGTHGDAAVVACEPNIRSRIYIRISICVSHLISVVVAVVVVVAAVATAVVAVEFVAVAVSLAVSAPRPLRFFSPSCHTTA